MYQMVVRFGIRRMADCLLFAGRSTLSTAQLYCVSCVRIALQSILLYSTVHTVQVIVKSNIRIDTLYSTRYVNVNVYTRKNRF